MDFISACQPLDQRLISCSISGYSSALSVPVSNLSAPVSPLVSAYQQLDQYLPGTFSTPVSHYISTCQPLNQRPLGCVIRAYSATRSVTLSRLISACQPFDHFRFC